MVGNVPSECRTAGERAMREITETAIQLAPPREGREMTILDVAREAGVSKSTVSRVLNDLHVSLTTREHVLAVVKRMDFRANSAARGLRTTRSSLVGLLVPAINNDVFSRVAEVTEVMTCAGSASDS